MEEGESKGNREVPGGDQEIGESVHVDELVAAQNRDSLDRSHDLTNAVDINTVTEDDNLVGSVLEEEFEPVSLKDHDNSVGDLDTSLSSDNIRPDAGGGEAYEGFSDKTPSASDSPVGFEVHCDSQSPSPSPSPSPTPGQLGSSNHINQLPSPGNQDSGRVSFEDSGSSSLSSPQKLRPNQGTPNISPELLHLVDSAIMGKSESLENLKNAVSNVKNFGVGEDADTISRLVTESLLATMGGVESFDEEEDDNPPSVMHNSRAAIVCGELIPSLPCLGDDGIRMSPRTHMVRGLLAILRACTRNRAMCSAAGLLGVLLRSAEKIFSTDNACMDKVKWNGTPLCYCIQLLAGHSLSASDLHRWFEVITRTVGTPWATHLMVTLEKAMSGKESRGPACTFEFDGESSGLLGPGESRWPFSNGFAFATWIYIESFADTLNTATAAAEIAAAAAATSGKSSHMSAAAAASALAGEGSAHMPRLFSFLSADNQGMEAYFHAQFLVVECGSGKGRKTSLHFTHAFKPQCWYFVGLEHTSRKGLLGKAENELRLYVDGHLYESRPFELPRISKPLSFCCIGTNPPPTMAGLQRRRRQCPLFAEMGPIYIFREPIGQERMSRLASRGGDALPSFGNGAGSPWLATNDHLQSIAEESTLLDAEIAGSLHLLYHPYLLNGRFCPDASPAGASGMHRKPAEVLGQVYVAMRIRPNDALWSIAHGGPMSLLPLVVSDVHDTSLEPLQGDVPLILATSALAAPIFRIIAMAMQHPGNNEEIARRRGPEVLSRILHYLLKNLSSLDVGKHEGVSDEELVAAVVSICQSQKYNHRLKVQLFSTLLLDLKMWSLCSYGLQKKLLSSLADMVFTEASVMRDANAIQMLLDGCRKCYWTIREAESIDTFSMNKATRPVGEVNALVDELLVIVELLILAAPPSLAVDDTRCLLGFMVDCPQPNQVARVLLLIYRLVVQPNGSRAQTFAEAFISSGGVETLLVLLQREAKAGDSEEPDSSLKDNGVSARKDADEDSNALSSDSSKIDGKIDMETFQNGQSFDISTGAISVRRSSNIERASSVSESPFLKTLGGITMSISAENARNNVYNADRGDRVVLGIINLLGALVTSKHIKLDQHAAPDMSNNAVGVLERGGTMFDDKVSLLLFALQKAFQAAPNRLMTRSVYTVLLGVSINAPTTDEGLNFHDSNYRFEHLPLLLVLLRSLPYASTALQSLALQDLLILACSHSDNRRSLTNMDEWPEWILEILISNYETGGNQNPNLSGLKDVEDFIHNFLIIILDHSMRRKDGWQDIEATIHCAEWLSMVGGSSRGDQRIRREESLPIFKRRLLGGLLDFAARELQDQTQVIASAAAVVAAGGLSPNESKIEAENAAQRSVALVENSIVILMLVEDHLRLQSKLYCASRFPAGSVPSASVALPTGAHSSSVVSGGDPKSSSSDSDKVSLDVHSSGADSTRQPSPGETESLNAATAAEPYDSVCCAFASYGSCTMDLANGWKYRSRLWFGVGLSPKTSDFGGAGSGWDAWKSSLEIDSNGSWVELPLINKSVIMLQALLLDESGLGGGLGIGGGSGTGMGAMASLYQLLDSDQPFLSMLRMVLVSLREDDDGETHLLMRPGISNDGSAGGLHQQTSSSSSFNTKNGQILFRKPRAALLWSVLSPVLNMPISESKRQRVLVASCVLYSEIFHSVGADRTPLRKQYLEAILPPFIAVLRRWRPLLAGIHELATMDGVNPLVAEDRALAADSLPVEAALAMISPGWAAAFASPPAAMALAMLAAGAGGGETRTPAANTHLKRDSSVVERRAARLNTFSSFQRPLEVSSKSSYVAKDKAAAKAAALAAARDLERNAKIGSGRGLSAVAMATSSQRRNKSDTDRVKRWNLSEAMETAWMECLQSADSKSVYGKDFNVLSYKYIAVLVGSLALARNMQRSEVDRRTQVDLIARHRLYTGIREWGKLLRCLIEMQRLFGPFSHRLCNPPRVYWKLDPMESSDRMRRCLRRDYQGSAHFGAAANYEDPVEVKTGNNNVMSPSKASTLAAEAISMDVMNEDDEHEENLHIEGRPDNIKQNEERLLGSPKSAEQPLPTPRETTTPLFTEDQDLVKNSLAVAPGYVPSEQDESIVLELPSSMVQPLKILRGTFQITSRRINFIVDKSESYFQGDGLDRRQGTRVEEKDKSWPLSSLHQIYSRRYLLRRSALELFMVDRSNFFFDFGSSVGRQNAYRAVVQARPPNLNNIYLATQRPEQLLKRTQLMERWAKREISNFEYLMQLNTLAGRSYNDITQYPVFPWILSDYESSTLDLSNPSSYRDLSKPVGALNPDGLKKVQERYSSFNDPVIPKFHYGSHYSSAGTVLYYLLRVEPFTTLSIQLQGGKFDHADRMFTDIGATWNGILEEISDVKELVPELFYMSEMLSNENSVDFGTTQLGEKLDSVRLPPWADNTVDFVHKHRMALESEHVSAHLHEWIDLIFGYKQRGKEAISANNVFFYITYEGTVDIDKITDPVLQRATQDQIAYFGQTPSQLLTVPHMKRMPLGDALHLQTIFRNPREVKPYVVPHPEHCNLPAAAMRASSDSLVIVDVNAPAAHIAQHKWQPNTPDGQGSPFLFQHGKASANDSGTFMRMFRSQSSIGTEESHFPQALAFAASGIRSSAIVSITRDREIITGGHVDNSIRVISADGAKTLEIAKGHCAPVTCVSLSPDNNYIVTGSRDATVLLWRLHHSSTSGSVNTSDSSTRSGTPTSVSKATSNSFSEKNRKGRIEGPIHVLRGHMSEIASCCVNSDVGVVVSCSISSDVLLHSIRRGRLIRRLEGAEANAVCLSRDGIVMVWSKSLCAISTFTLNGVLIARAYLPFASSICCMEISIDGQNALIGFNPSSNNNGSSELNKQLESASDNISSESVAKHAGSRLEIPLPSICLFDIYTLKMFHSMKLNEGQDITSLALNKDNTNLLVSTADRKLIIFTDPALSLKVVDQMLKLGWEGDGLSPLMK